MQTEERDRKLEPRQRYGIRDIWNPEVNNREREETRRPERERTWPSGVGLGGRSAGGPWPASCLPSAGTWM